MLRYTANPKPEKSVKVYGRGMRISRKSSVILCRIINNMRLEKGKMFLDRLIEQKESINGKYYTNVSKELLRLLQSAENNADFKGLDASKLSIHASAHKGFTFYTPKRFKRRGRRRKVCNIQIILEQM